MRLIQAFWDRLRDPTLGGLWVGLILFWFGAWLLFPFDTFSTSVQYGVMETMASEFAWGVVMVAGSVFLVAGTFQDDSEWSSVGAVIAAFCYFFIWSSIASAEWRSVGTPVYFILMVRSFMLWLAWRHEALRKRRHYREWLASEKQRLIKDNTP